MRHQIQCTVQHRAISASPIVQVNGPKIQIAQLRLCEHRAFDQKREDRMQKNCLDYRRSNQELCNLQLKQMYVCTSTDY